MRRLSAATSIILLALSSQTARAEPATVSLARVGPWEMNYDVDSCHLRAKFGSGNQEILMDMTRLAPTSAFDLTLLGKPLASDTLHVDARFAFGDRRDPVTRAGLAGNSAEPERRPILIFSGLRIDGLSAASKNLTVFPDITPEDEAATNFITFKLPARKFYRLETGSLGAPFGALRKCTINLVRSWGYDPDVQLKLTRYPQPVGKAENWLSSSDYPVPAIQQGQSAQLTVRLDVEETGTVSGCRVLYRTNGDEFAKVTCQLLLRRAKMAPALDEHDKPVRAFYIRKIVWLAG